MTHPKLKLVLALPVLILGIGLMIQGQTALADIDPNSESLSDSLANARAVPHFENGEANGYTVVAPSAKVPADQTLELRNGDVIRSIDGQKPQDPHQAFQMLGAKSSRPIEVGQAPKQAPASDEPPESVELY